MSGSVLQNKPSMGASESAASVHDQVDDFASNSERESLAARARAQRDGEGELLLPNLAPPTKSVWEQALADAFHDGLRGFVSAVPQQGGDLSDFGDASAKFAEKAALSLVETGFEQMGGSDRLLELAKEYPVPAAVIAGAVAYGASEWLEKDPTLKLKIKLSPISDNLKASISHNLDTGNTSFKLQFKYEF